MRRTKPILVAAAVLSTVAVLAPLPSADAGNMIVWTRKSNPGPSAREQAGRSARQQINAAQKNFNKAYAEAVRNHPLKGEIEKTRAELTRSRTDLFQTVRTTRATANDMPEIKAQRAVVERMQREMDGVKDTSVRLDVARDLLDARKRLTQLEYNAIEGDVYVVLARATLQEATNKLTGLEGQYQTLLRADPGFAAAKDQLDAARKNLLSLK